jgi:hypothetical protein
LKKQGRCACFFPNTGDIMEESLISDAKIGREKILFYSKRKFSFPG